MTTLDPEKQKQAKEYSRISRRLWLVETLYSLAYTLAWLFFGWAIGLRQWLTGFTSNEWLLVPAFAAIFSGFSALVDLPLGITPVSFCRTASTSRTRPSKIG